MVSQVFVKICQILHFKYAQFVKCQLYLNKPILKSGNMGESVKYKKCSFMLSWTHTTTGMLRKHLVHVFRQDQTEKNSKNCQALS